LGIFPLVIAVGAGAKSRQSLGTAVFGGMLIATFLSLFVVPILYIVIGNMRDRFKPGGGKPQPAHQLEPSADGKVPSESRL
jgi:hypothetical protein